MKTSTTSDRNFTLSYQRQQEQERFEELTVEVFSDKVLATFGNLINHQNKEIATLNKDMTSQANEHRLWYTKIYALI